MPVYEYRCEECGKRSSTLLGSYASPDPPCPHCGKPALRRLVSTFATVSSSGDDFGGDDGGDFGGDGEHEHHHEHDEWDGGGDDFGGGDFGDDY